jgi:hypothetical protein
LITCAGKLPFAKGAPSPTNEGEQEDQDSPTNQGQDFDATTSNKQLAPLCSTFCTMLKTTEKAAVVLPDNSFYLQWSWEKKSQKASVRPPHHSALSLSLYNKQGALNVPFRWNKPVWQDPDKEVLYYDFCTNKAVHFLI